MQDKGLLFIPDISGFTAFVNSTEIEHSRHIIEELLEKLLESNPLSLKVSEIEGDAILYYSFGVPPSFDQLLQQVSLMFIQFHSHLKNYEYQRICNCGACSTATNLTLKIITHYGEFSTYQVKNHNKLFGKDIIIAHRLLKNEGIGNEYWLVTDQLFRQLNFTSNLDWMTWEYGSQRTDNKVVNFRYAKLTHLKDTITVKPSGPITSSHRLTNAVRIKKLVSVNAYAMVQVVTNLTLRPQWLAGVKAIRNSDHKINQLNNTHSCVISNRCDIITTTSYKRSDSTIVYREAVKGMGEFQYSFEIINSESTLLTLEFDLSMNPFMELMFRILQKSRMVRNLEKSIEKLIQLAQSDYSPITKK